jgi:hypothetical protein
VLSTLTLGGGREIYAELHHDGSVVPAADLSWKAMREAVPGEVPEECLVLRQDVVGGHAARILLPSPSSRRAGSAWTAFCI